MDSAPWKADEYAAESSGQYRTAMEALALAGAHLHSGGRFADVGCGTGEIAAAMAERAFEVTASDASPSMIEATLGRCAGLNVRAEVRDARKLDLAAGRFDVVHSSWMLHWLDDAEHALRTMARAVGPGGQLVLQWSFGQPGAAGFPLLEVLQEVVARPRWRERLAATPLAMFHHPVEWVREVLEEERLEVTAVQADIEVPGGRDPESLRRVTRTTAFAAQAEALGDDGDHFIDEALAALFAAGRTNVHNTRIIARRPDDTAPPQVRAFPLAVGELEVVAAESLTRRMRRLTFRGPQVAALPIEEPGEIITLIWPAPGADGVVLPEVGRWRFPPGTTGQHARNFTVRDLDRAAGLVVIDFYLHGPGQAADWARTAEPGDRIGFGGTRVHWVTDPTAEWTLLVGDETALPAIDAIAGSRPEGHPVIAVIEVASTAEEAALSAGDAAVHWVHRGGVDLERVVRDLDFPAGRPQIWAAGESLAIQRLRRHLLGERALPRDVVSALGYWNHPRSG